MKTVAVGRARSGTSGENGVCFLTAAAEEALDLASLHRACREIRASWEAPPHPHTLTKLRRENPGKSRKKKKNPMFF